MTGQRTFDLPFPGHTVQLHTTPVTGNVADLSHADAQDLHWGCVWPAALALAAVVLQRQIPLPRSPVLELGCGTGLVSLAVALIGGQVCATDRAPAALDLVRANAAGNHVSERISTAVLDWSLPPPSRWSLILGADLLYQPEAGRQVAGFLRAALSDDGLALITDPDRSAARHFHYIAQEAGLTVELSRLPVPFVDGHGPVCDIAAPAAGLTVTLFTLRQRPSSPPLQLTAID